MIPQYVSQNFPARHSRSAPEVWSPSTCTPQHANGYKQTPGRQIENEEIWGGKNRTGCPLVEAERALGANYQTTLCSRCDRQKPSKRSANVVRCFIDLALAQRKHATSRMVRAWHGEVSGSICLILLVSEAMEGSDKHPHLLLMHRYNRTQASYVLWFLLGSCCRGGKYYNWVWKQKAKHRKLVSILLSGLVATVLP